MKELITNLLNALDEVFVKEFPGRSLLIYHVGRSSLVWKYGFQSATRDVDILTPDGSESDREMWNKALAHFGSDTTNAKELGVYLDAVPNMLPWVPNGYRKRAIRVVGPWRSIELFHLEPHDLIVTKLRRFAAKDRQDIQQLCELIEIDPDLVEQRLESAYYLVHPQYEDSDRESSFANLRKLQQFLSGDSTEL